MKLYFLLDSLLDDEKPETAADKLVAALTDWLVNSDSEISLINERPEDVDEWQVGLQFDCQRKAALKAPLEFLFQWAKKAEREFVIGFYDKQSSSREDVCYFGHEEGRPDINEIAMYLGLKK